MTHERKRKVLRKRRWSLGAWQSIPQIIKIIEAAEYYKTFVLLIRTYYHGLWYSADQRERDIGASQSQLFIPKIRRTLNGYVGNRFATHYLARVARYGFCPTPRCLFTACTKICSSKTAPNLRQSQPSFSQVPNGAARSQRASPTASRIRAQLILQTVDAQLIQRPEVGMLTQPVPGLHRGNFALKIDA